MTDSTTPVSVAPISLPGPHAPLVLPNLRPTQTMYLLLVALVNQILAHAGAITDTQATVTSIQNKPTPPAIAYWGGIIGTLASQPDLVAALAATHTGWTPLSEAYGGGYSSIWQATGSAPNINAVLSPSGYGALIGGPVPDGTALGGNVRGPRALCWQNYRIYAYQVASGYGSVAVGNGNTASAQGDVAVGYFNVARGTQASAFGNNNHATSAAASALGVSNYASAIGASGLGYRNYASGNRSSSFGYYNHASGHKSSAFGNQSYAHAAYSSAFGYKCSVPVGYTNASAFGNQAVCDRDNSFAIGQTGGERQLIHVADGTTATDGATVGQLSAFAVPDVQTINTTPNTETATTGIRVRLIDCTSGNIIENLPTAVGNEGVWYMKKIDSTSHTAILTPSGGQTIDGGSTAVITMQYESITLFSDNANWRIV